MLIAIAELVRQIAAGIIVALVLAHQIALLLQRSGILHAV